MAGLLFAVSAFLAVAQDFTPPTLLDALNLGNPGNTLAIVFSEPVDATTATVPGSYGIDNGASITAARMGASPDTVLLNANGVIPGSLYILTVSNVRDLAGNVIGPGSAISLEERLETWYRVDESSGTVAADSSGFGRTGTLTSGAAPGYQGKILWATKFDGIDDHVRLPDGYADFSFAGLTMAFWANPSTIGLWARFIELGNAAGSDNILMARSVTFDNVTFEVYTGGLSGGKVEAVDVIVNNQWQHFVATLQPWGETVIYRNGIPVVTNNTALPNIVTRTNNFLGRSNWGGDAYYGGKLDDVRIYSRVLSAPAVLALAAGGGPDDIDASIPVLSVAATVPTTALHNSPPGRFTVTRTGSTAAPLTFNYALTGTATNGVNYTNLPLAGVIAAGATTATIFIQPIDFSFTDAQRSAILGLVPSPGYIAGDQDQAVVTIANNNVAPTPLLAFARNSGPGVARNTVEVWFGAPVTSPSATTPANYTFNPALTITNASLSTRSLRVLLDVAESVPANTVVTVTGVQDPGGNSVSNQLPVSVYLSNTANVVANSYNSPPAGHPGRGGCLYVSTDGVVDNLSNEGGFDTWGSDTTDYAGLLYSSSVEMRAIKIDLGRQFGDGGSWGTTPKLYRLKDPVDPDGYGFPELVPGLWEEVPATIISGSQFNTAGDANPSPNTPIVFNLSNVTPSQRTGYGWAVGGVAGDGTATFVSITELSAYGIQGSTPAFLLAGTPSTFNVVAGQRAKLKFSTTMPVTCQWQRNGIDLFGETKSYYGLPPVTPGDNSAVYTAVLSYNGSPLTNLSATLTVIPRATPPVVRNATFDPNNSVITGVTNPVIDVWFDESVDSTSAQNVGNYALNDPGLSIISAVPDAQGFRAVLTYSGAATVNNMVLTVSSIQDLSGNTLTSQAVPVSRVNGPAARVVANAYQQGRTEALIRSTEGTIINDANVTTWTTFGSPTYTTDFVGLGYAQPQVFNAVVMDLGWQFGDGGDWSEKPRVFVQKSAADTNQKSPETDTANWVEVPAVLMSGNIFDGEIAVPANTTPLPNAVIAFDLSQLPLSQRTGFGWAIGGVPGNAIPGLARFVTVAELRGFGAPASTLTNIVGPPEFALNIQPTAITKLAGAGLTLSTIVTGTQPLTYQWRHNGVNLSDTGRIFGTHSNILTIAELFGSDAGTYQLIVTNSAGSNASAVATVAVTTGIPALNGGTNWTVSGGASITGAQLQLTSGFNQGMSAFLDDPLYIGAFRAAFTYQDVGGGGADGTVFVLQNSPAGPWALGGAGGEIGYAPTVSPSVGLVLNIYSGAPGGRGFSVGINGSLNLPYLATAPVNLASGDPIAVSVGYDGSRISMTLSNKVTHGTFAASAPLDIPTTVGANTAYVGFTAGSGGLMSNQRVTDFTFTSLPAITIVPLGGNLVFSWPVAVGNFLLQETSSLSAPAWSNVSAPVDLVGQRNQVVVPTPPGTRFFRLMLQ